MMLAHRLPGTQAPALPRVSVGALSFDRATGPLLACALLLSVVFAGLTARRIVRVERDIQPALQDARQLGAALEATRVLLRDSRLGTADVRIARADSQAQRFHLVAGRQRPGAGQRARMLAHDDTFGAYYVAARRAAAGLSMSADADGSSAEDASLGFAMLRENLAAGVEAEERAMDAARPATAPVELAGWLSLMLLSAAALLRRTARQWQVAPSIAEPAAPARKHYVPVPSDDGPAAALPLAGAVERLARKRLAASAAAARVAQRNNARQVELARGWHAPTPVELVSTRQPAAEMSVYEDEAGAPEPRYGALSLVQSM